MVSHITEPAFKTQSVKFWPSFHFQGEGYSRVVKTQSAKFWPTFHLGLGWVGMGGLVYSKVAKTQSAKFWPNFNFGGGEGRYSWPVQNRVFPDKMVKKFWKPRLPLHFCAQKCSLFHQEKKVYIFLPTPGRVMFSEASVCSQGGGGKEEVGLPPLW